METRLTLRINNNLNKSLEEQKEKTGLSKNQLIVEACKKLISELKEGENGNDKARVNKNTYGLS